MRRANRVLLRRPGELENLQYAPLSQKVECMARDADAYEEERLGIGISEPETRECNCLSLNAHNERMPLTAC